MFRMSIEAALAVVDAMNLVVDAMNLVADAMNLVADAIHRVRTILLEEGSSVVFSFDRLVAGGHGFQLGNQKVAE